MYCPLASSKGYWINCEKEKCMFWNVKRKNCQIVRWFAYQLPNYNEEIDG